MIEKLSLYISESLNPYENLGVEEFFLHTVENNELIFYLWQNDKTVVIGHNQDPQAEVNLEELRKIGGFSTRRLSGGGAVYHDKGNLNFTFVTRDCNYNKDRQTKVIMNAVGSLGFDVIKSQRNDLLIDGRKFSGHSYYHYKDRWFHNGTILVNTDFDIMLKVLTPSKEKLEHNGVISIRARVVNLSELLPSVNIDKVKQALVECLEKEYGLRIQTELSPIISFQQAKEHFSITT